MIRLSWVIKNQSGGEITHLFIDDIIRLGCKPFSKENNTNSR